MGTPALSRLICLEGSDESSYQKAAVQLEGIGGIAVGQQQVHREMLRLGPAAAWLSREGPPQCIRFIRPGSDVIASGWRERESAGSGQPERPQGVGA